MNRHFQYAFGFLLLCLPNLASGAPMAPQPGDGTSQYRCHVNSSQDINGLNAAVSGSLRHRIELYNKSDNEGAKCYFLIYFINANQTITLNKSLLLENRQRDRDLTPSRTVLTGTYISGYGTDGLRDKMNITVDAVNVTEQPDQCAFMLKDGIAARQQIHGITIKVTDSKKAICDETGKDLMSTPSLAAAGKIAGEGEFANNTIVIVPSDLDDDGILDRDDNCPRQRNIQQADEDEDNIGDDCDLYLNDTNNNGLSNDEECSNNPNAHETGIDEDGDQIDDGCDPMVDSDNDGIANQTDLCRELSQVENDDHDGDSLKDSDDPYPCLSDKDHDGTADKDDACPENPQRASLPCILPPAPESPDGDEETPPNPEEPTPEDPDPPSPENPSCGDEDTNNNGVPDCDENLPPQGSENADSASSGCSLKLQASTLHLSFKYLLLVMPILLMTSLSLFLKKSHRD